MGLGRLVGSQRILRSAGCGAFVAAALWFVGCEKGLPPTHVIPSDGARTEYLPSDGVSPGTRMFTDSLYVYDRTRFSIYSVDRDPFIPVGTDQRYIKRGEVLSIVGATQDEIRFPDQIPGPDGDLLRQVYSKSYLFGFEIGDSQSQGFIAGEVFQGTEQLLPLSGPGETWWDYNHVQFQWTRRDTVVGQTSASTTMGGPEWLVRSVCLVRADLSARFIPAAFEQDIVMSAVPGSGLFLHGWTLVAERDEVVPETEFRAPAPQRNPRFLWVAKGGLGGTSPAEREFTSIDQCVDGLWGELELFPVQLAAGDIRVGERYVTWTYVSADSSKISLRANGPAASAGQTTSRDSLRCIGFGVRPQNVPVDGPAFPVYYMSLLARYEVAVEEVYDQLQWRLGNSLVGEYGAVDGIIDVVKFAITVQVGAPADAVVQRLDMYLMRNVGAVVQAVGTDPTRTFLDTSRLRSATINGVFYDEAFFGYRDF